MARDGVRKVSRGVLGVVRLVACPVTPVGGDAVESRGRTRWWREVKKHHEQGRSLKQEVDEQKLVQAESYEKGKGSDKHCAFPRPVLKPPLVAGDRFASFAVVCRLSPAPVRLKLPHARRKQNEQNFKRETLHRPHVFFRSPPPANLRS